MKSWAPAWTVGAPLRRHLLLFCVKPIPLALSAYWAPLDDLHAGHSWERNRITSVKAKSAAQMSLAFVTLSVAPNKISESSPVSEILKGRLLKKKSCRKLVNQVLFCINHRDGACFWKKFFTMFKLFARAGGNQPSVLPFFSAVEFVLE